MDKKGLIGAGDKLPWHLPSDLRFFRDTTLGQTVVMGSKTYASLGRPLPNRKNIVLSRSGEYTVKDVIAMAASEDVFIIGGAEIYKIFIPFADQIIITHIDAVFDGDVYFPMSKIDPYSFYKADSRKGFDEASKLGFEIIYYKRNQ
jgi:dihydrofolate reductase